MATQSHNQHRTNVAWHFPKSQQILTITPTPADTTQYAGTIFVHDCNGVEVASTAYDYTSDADATAAEIVTGITADLTGGDVDNFADFSGTDTLVITTNVGYVASMDNTGAGVLTAVSTGGANLIGQVPADAAAWVAAEANTTAGRIMAEEFGPEFIRGAEAVPSADMQTRVGEHQVPHHGLPTATGGSARVRIYGTGRSYEAGKQVQGTLLGRLLGNALGGRNLGQDTAVGTVNTPVSFDLDDVANTEIGQIIWIEDADDLGRLWPAQITSVSGSTVGIDIAPNFTVAIADKIYGSEQAYFDQAAITDCTNPNAASPNFLIQKGPHVWVGGVGHASLDEIACERGQQPKMTFGVQAARGYPPGDGAPSEPAWTGTVEGAADVQAIGRDTHVTIQDYATGTFVETKLLSASVTPGIPVEMQEAVTEDDEGAPGWAGWMTVPTPTTIELVVQLDTAFQAQWTARSLHKVRYYQVGPVGATWCVHLQKAFLMEPPEPVLEGSNRWRLRYQATDDIDAGTTEIAMSKIHIART
jgi:hypothetical protein